MAETTESALTHDQVNEFADIANEFINTDIPHWDGYSLSGIFADIPAGELTPERINRRMNEDMDAFHESVLDNVGYEYSGTIDVHSTLSVLSAVFGKLCERPEMAAADAPESVSIHEPSVLYGVLAENWSLVFDEATGKTIGFDTYEWVGDCLATEELVEGWYTYIGEEQ